MKVNLSMDDIRTKVEEYIKKVCIYDPWLKEYEG